MRSGDGSAPACLPKKLFSCGRGQGGVAVGGADHAELVGVGAQSGFQFQAALEGFPGVLARQHGIGLGLGHIEVADIPGLVVGEFVIG